MGSCYQRVVNCIFGLFVIAAIAGGALYFYVLPRLDNLLADAVRREYILPPSATVVITRGSLLDTLEGEVARFYVDAEEAKLDGLLVKDLRFLAEGIRFDLPRTLISGQAELLNVSHGQLSLSVSEEALEERWSEELASKGLSKVDVELSNEGVGVSAVVDLKLTEVRVGAKGYFEVDGTDRIRFHATDLELAGTSIGIAELKAAFSTLTPVISLGRFKMHVVVDELFTSAGHLFIETRSQSLEEKIAADRQRLKERQQAAEAEAKEAGEQQNAYENGDTPPDEPGSDTSEV